LDVTNEQVSVRQTGDEMREMKRDIGFLAIVGCFLMFLAFSGCPNRPSNQGQVEMVEKQKENVSQKLNLFLYVIDALRADHLGCYGYPRSTSPNIDKLSRQSLVFAAAVAQSSWTRPAMASVLTGFYPRKHGALTHDDQLSSEFVLLSELLQSQGYQNYAFVANLNVGVGTGFDQGYFRFYCFPEKMGEVGLQTRSEKINKALLPTINNFSSARSYFVYVHAVDPHDPYLPGEKCLSATNTIEFNEEYFKHKRYCDIQPASNHLEQLVAAYDDEIRFNDKMFGLFLQTLERKRMLDHSVVTFISDHGEELHDHGGFLHGSNLFEEQLRIPLMMRLPDRQHVLSTQIVNQIDILPTLCHLLSCPVPNFIDGKNVIEGNFPQMVSYSELSNPTRKKSHFLAVTSAESKVIVETQAGIASADYRWFSHEANVPITAEIDHITLGIASFESVNSISMLLNNREIRNETINQNIKMFTIPLPDTRPVLLTIRAQNSCKAQEADRGETLCRSFRLFSSENLDLERAYESRSFHFYNLQDDPQELLSTFSDNVSSAEEMLELWNKFTCEHIRPIHEVPKVVLNDAQKAELKALGYIE